MRQVDARSEASEPEFGSVEGQFLFQAGHQRLRSAKPVALPFEEADDAAPSGGAQSVAQALSLLLAGHKAASYGVRPGAVPSPVPTPSVTQSATPAATRRAVRR